VRAGLHAHVESNQLRTDERACTSAHGGMRKGQHAARPDAHSARSCPHTCAHVYVHMMARKCTHASIHKLIRPQTRVDTYVYACAVQARHQVHAIILDAHAEPKLSAEQQQHKEQVCKYEAWAAAGAHRASLQLGRIVVVQRVCVLKQAAV